MSTNTIIVLIYEGESVNRSHMDIKLKTCDIRSWKKYLFFGISSSNIDPFVSVRRDPQRRSLLTVVSPTSAPGRASSGLSNVLERISRPSCEWLYATNTSHRKRETCIYAYPLHWVLLPIKKHNRTLLFGSSLLKHGLHFDYWNQSLLPRLSWSWIALLPCDIHKKYYVHYSCFTSICGLLTDSPSCRRHRLLDLT
jgi:hypothetical protein